MGARSLLLTLAAAAAVAACTTGTADDPPGPAPTQEPAVPSCPPPEGLREQTVTIPLRDALRLPGSGRVRVAEVTGTARLEVVRADAACDDSVELELPAGGSATALGLSVTVVSINSSSGGMPPTVQVRVGPA